MPVLLELINRPDAADLADLEKIYADYPRPPHGSFEHWLDAQREVGATLVAGRFNDRLLAALWLRDGWIEHLCVRAITRRRGTARQLLQLLQSHAEQLQLKTLRIASASASASASACAGTGELAVLWRQLGFEPDGSDWVWRR